MPRPAVRLRNCAGGSTAGRNRDPRPARELPETWSGPPPARNGGRRREPGPVYFSRWRPAPCSIWLRHCGSDDSLPPVTQSAFQIGVDGGGSKTEGILVDPSGAIVARHRAPGCNPNVIGAAQSRRVLADTVNALLGAAPAGAIVSDTHCYLAGTRTFGGDLASGIERAGQVTVNDDSLPILELATKGGPGMVLHAGTGSFVAARAPDGAVHYAGGLGWRFGDPGGGHDLGRRALARMLLEAQGWMPPSSLGRAVRAKAKADSGNAEPAALARYYYQHPDPNGAIAAFGPEVLRLAAGGELEARRLVAESLWELVELARRVAARLFPGVARDSVLAGLSGPVLMHPAARAMFAAPAPLRLFPVEGTPIDGVHHLLVRIRTGDAAP